MKSRSRMWTDWMQAVGVSLSALMLVGAVMAQDVMPPEDLVTAPKKEYTPFVEYPPRQKPGSFSIDQVLDKLQTGGTSSN